MGLRVLKEERVQGFKEFKVEKKEMAANKTMIQNNVLDNQAPNKSILVNQGFLFVLLVTGSNIMMCVLIITTCKFSHIGLPGKENRI